MRGNVSAFMEYDGKLLPSGGCFFQHGSIGFHSWRMVDERMTDENRYFGKDCPKGMVQVEFVSVSPDLRYSDYGWKPSETAMIDVYVDGDRYNISIGNVETFDPETGAHSCQRGLRIIGPAYMVVHKDSVNAFSVHKPQPPKDCE